MTGRNAQQRRAFAAENEYVQHVARGAVRADVVQGNPEPALRESQPIGLPPMIDPGANRSGFGRDLVDVHDRLDRSVARGQQFAERSTRVGVGHEASVMSLWITP